MLHVSFRLYLRKAVRKIWYFSSDGACDVRDILSKLLSVPYYTLLTSQGLKAPTEVSGSYNTFLVLSSATCQSDLFLGSIIRYLTYHN